MVLPVSGVWTMLRSQGYGREAGSVIEWVCWIDEGDRPVMKGTLVWHGKVYSAVRVGIFKSIVYVGHPSLLSDTAKRIREELLLGSDIW
jgi:hypothetical protein